MENLLSKSKMRENIYRYKESRKELVFVSSRLHLYCYSAPWNFWEGERGNWDDFYLLGIVLLHSAPQNSREEERGKEKGGEFLLT